MNPLSQSHTRVAKLSFRHTRFLLLSSIVALPALLSACAGPSNSGRRNPRGDQEDGRRRGPGGNQPPERNGAQGLNLNERFKRAQSFWQQGDFESAVPLFREIALNGSGFENSQYMLGDSLVRLGEKDGVFSANYLEGLSWLRRAADAGWPEAQAKLMSIHFSGPAQMINLREAAFWREVYLHNIKRQRVGFVPTEEAVLSELDAALTEQQRAEAKTRATTWSLNPEIQ